MRFDLKVPCKNCPFRNGPDRIIFRGRERANEIAETAYRHGFPCHLSAVDTSDENEEFGGYEFRPDGETQHCAGALAMFINDCQTEWPGVDNDDELVERLSLQLSDALPICFESEEAFIEANADPEFDEEAA